jgi:Tol biopolymer transport system component
MDRQWIAEGGSQAGIPKPVIAHHKRRERLSWIVAAAVSIAALALAALHFSEKPADTYPVRFDQPLPPKVDLQFFDMPAISPDGRMFVISGTASDGKSGLWLRRMDSPQFTALPAAANMRTPFWSPDSRFIAYLSEGKLFKVDAAGGPAQFVANLLPASSGGSWNRDGVILIGRWNGPVYQVSAGGGEPVPVLALDHSRHETGQFWPQFLPDGRHFIYASMNAEPGKGGIYVSSIDKKESRQLLPQESNTAFVTPGYLLFGRGSTLMAQRFDPGKLKLAGDPQVVADPVGRLTLVPVSLFSASSNGALIYRSDSSPNTQLAWYDRTGRRLQSLGEPKPYKQGNLSPDEKRFLVQITDSEKGTDDIWLLDLSTGILSRLTSEPHSEDTPIWSPDGRDVVFSSNRSGPQALYRKVVGGGDEQPILPAAESNYPAEYLKDGSLLFMNRDGKSFFRLPPGPGAKPETLLKSEYSKDEPRVSPDGHWVAYNTNESGRWEVYVATFPAFTERRQVSSNGGVQGYWRKDGKELFYLTLDGIMMSMPVKPGPALETGIPQTLFQTRIRVTATSDQFAVNGDGQRFLLIESIENEVKPLTVILNWLSLLRR